MIFKTSCKSTADGEFWELEVAGAAPATKTKKEIYEGGVNYGI